MSEEQGTRFKILTYGELLWDMLPSGDALGGAPANFACRMQDLGAEVLLVSMVGQDDLGDRAARAIAQRGVSCTFLQRSGVYPTGTVSVTFSAAHDPIYTINREVAYDQIETSPALLTEAERADLIYFGTLVQRAGRSRETLYAVLEAGAAAVKFVDLNLRNECFSAATVKASLHAADLVKLNQSEVGVVAELLGLRAKDALEFCLRVIERFEAAACVVTLGEAGALAANSAGEVTYEPGYKVPLRDAIGAGDAFSAGFASAHLQALPLAQCCELGNALGALACTKQGGMERISAAELAVLRSGGAARCLDEEYRAASVRRSTLL